MIVIVSTLLQQQEAVTFVQLLILVFSFQVFTYAIISPVILPVGVLFFGGSLVVYKKQVIEIPRRLVKFVMASKSLKCHFFSDSVVSKCFLSRILPQKSGMSALISFSSRVLVLYWLNSFFRLISLASCLDGLLQICVSTSVSCLGSIILPAFWCFDLSERTRYESGGAMFPSALQRSLFGLVCGQLTLIGYLLTRGLFWQPFFLLPLPIFTMWGMGYFAMVRMHVMIAGDY